MYSGRTPLYKEQKFWSQSSKYSVNEPLYKGHPAIKDKFSGPVGVLYSGVSLYTNYDKIVMLIDTTDIPIERIYTKKLI